MSVTNENFLGFIDELEDKVEAVKQLVSHLGKSYRGR